MNYYKVALARNTLSNRLRFNVLLKSKRMNCSRCGDIVIHEDRLEELVNYFKEKNDSVAVLFTVASEEDYKYYISSEKEFGRREGLEATYSRDSEREIVVPEFVTAKSLEFKLGGTKRSSAGRKAYNALKAYSKPEPVPEFVPLATTRKPIRVLY